MLGILKEDRKAPSHQRYVKAANVKKYSSKTVAFTNNQLKEVPEKLQKIVAIKGAFKLLPLFNLR